jgi:hypothetical protein
MSTQKQKTHGGDGDGPATDHKNPERNEELAKAANQGKDILAKLDEAAKRKGGHWEHCCGVKVKVWVED